MTDDIKTIDKLLTPKAKTELEIINLIAVLPPAILAKRTIFVRQVDSTVGGRTANDIRDELVRLQPWLKIIEITKIKDYTHVFKIICSDSDSTTRLLTDGLKAFNTRITPNQMIQETYTDILICYNCYEYETRAAKDCTKTTFICSECA